MNKRMKQMKPLNFITRRNIMVIMVDIILGIIEADGGADGDADGAAEVMVHTMDIADFAEDITR